MRIDRYVHDERLTWGAASVLLVVTALHAAGIGRLLLTRLETADEAPPTPVFQVSMLKLPPPRLPPEVQEAPDTATDAVKQERPKVTRPVPILVDTPTTDPVPPDTQVKRYEMGDELLPGDPGPAMPEGTGDGDADGSWPGPANPGVLEDEAGRDEAAQLPTALPALRDRRHGAPARAGRRGRPATGR